MSTVVRRRSAMSRTDVPSTPAGERKPRRSRKLAVVVGLALAAIWAAPIVIAHSPLRHAVVGWCLSDLNGSVEVGSASLGWFSPLAAYDVEVRDAVGGRVLSVPEISGDTRLLSIALHPAALGTFKFQRPHLDLVVRDGGSNLEDVLDRMLRSTEPDSEGVDLGLEFTDGTATVRDAATNFEWRIDGLSASLLIPASDAGRTQVRVAGSFEQQDGPGAFSLQLASQSQPAASGEIVASADRFPLAVLQSPLRRMLPGCQIAGTFQGNLNCQWGDENNTPKIAIKGRGNIQRLTLLATALGNDQLHFEQIDAEIEAAQQGDELRVTRLVANTDVGQLSCAAVLPQGNQLWTTTGGSHWTEIVARGVAEISGKLDLARLAQLLPDTLKIRPGTQITSGMLSLQSTSRPQNGRVAWEGKLEATRLAALHQGRELTWDRPMLITVAAQGTDAGLSIEKLECQSDFLQLQGSGTAAAFQGNGSFDLNRLAEELGKFVDLDQTQLAGTGQAELRWQRGDDHRVSAQARAKLEGLEVQLASGVRCSEPQLTLAASAAGFLSDDFVPQRIDAGQAELIAGSDRMTLELEAAVVNPTTAGSTWPLKISATGDAAAWVRRISPWLPAAGGWQAEGQIALDADASYSLNGLDVRQATLTSQPLRLKTDNLFVDEPTARLTASANYQPLTRRVEIRSAEFDTPALQAKAKDIAVDWSDPTSSHVRGNMEFNGDVNRLVAWRRAPSEGKPWQITGRLHGRAQLVQNGNRSNLQWESTLENLLATPPSGRQWQEPRAQLNAQVAYDRSSDLLTIDRVQVASEMLEFDASGDIRNLGSTREMRLSGRSTYDLDKLSRVLEPFLGTNIRMAGRESHSFSLDGPLGGGSPETSNLAKLHGKAELGWQWLNVYGFDLGRGVMQSELSEGTLRAAPFEIAANNGKLRLAPQLRLEPGPTTLLMPPGQIIERVDITPEMCKQGLMYVLPALAGVVQAQGKFSVALDGCRIPIETPETGDLAGRLTIHEVNITPGPLMQELATLSGRPGTARLKQESQVDFRMVDGRIYHQGMELAFPDLVIRTHGSVGLDQTLAIIAEMPIPPKWLGNNPLGDSLRNQTIQLPIGGTLSRPQLDRRAMDQVAAKFLRDAGTGLLQEQIDQGLNKLFGPLQGQP